MPCERFREERPFRHANMSVFIVHFVRDPRFEIHVKSN